MKLSLLLPVYNVEAYLGKCIESCLNQDLPTSEYEIIIVIDGSPDHSIDIARHFQKKHKNIRIVERENGGVSAARNTGLKEAKGDFIWFIDPDDYIQKNVFGNISIIMQANQLDVLWIGWDEVNERGETLPIFAKHANKVITDIMSGKIFMATVLSNYLFAWSFIFRRNFLCKNNLEFIEGTIYFEDADFALRFLPLVKRIQLYNRKCYFYLQREGSVTKATSKKTIIDIAKNCIATNILLKSCDKSLRRFYQICFTSFYMLFLKEVLKSRNKEYFDFIIEQTKMNNFGKVSMFGNIKTKAIGVIYNIFGVEKCLRIISFIIK